MGVLRQRPWQQVWKGSPGEEQGGAQERNKGDSRSVERLKDRVGEEKALVTGRIFRICDNLRSTVVTLADVEDTCMGRPEIATKGC